MGFNEFYFPSNDEFIQLYIGFAILFVILLIGVFKRSSFFKWNLLVYTIYSLCFLSMCTNKENFKGGMSLLPLVYGYIILGVHSFVLIAVPTGKMIYKRLKRYSK